MSISDTNLLFYMGNIKTGVLIGTYKTKKLPKIYITWAMMKQRCYNKNHIAYNRYSKKGITVCDEWKNNFEQFYLDMNESMEEHIKIHGKINTTLDRINNDKGYCKENCRWATRKEQANNTDSNFLINGQKLQDFSKENKIKPMAAWCLIRTYGKSEAIKMIKNKSYFQLKKIELNKSRNNSKKNKKLFFKKNSLEKLPLKHQQIFIYKYGLYDNINRTLQETGRHFSLSTERIRQIESKYL